MQDKNDAWKKDPQLQELYDEWQKAYVVFQQRESFFAKREALHEQIVRFEDDLAHKLFLHDGKPSVFLQEQIVQAQEALHLLKKKQKEIDHFLDTIEEMQESHLYACEERIAQRLSLFFPDCDREYATYRRQEEGLLQEIVQIQKLCEIAISLLHFLEQVLAIQKAFQKRGFLDYVFGKSPTYALVEAREQFKQVLYESVHEVHEVVALDELGTMLRRDFLHTLMRMKREGDQRWNFGWVQRHVSRFIEEIGRIERRCRVEIEEKEGGRKEARMGIRRTLLLGLVQGSD